MKMKTNVKISIDPINFLKDFFRKYNLVMFIVLVAGGLTAAVMLIDNILLGNIPLSQIATPPASDTVVFDELTIQKLNQYKTSNENNNSPDATGGRTNPFAG